MIFTEIYPSDLTNTESGGSRGFDGVKRPMATSLYIFVDTNGLVLNAVVHEANIKDRQGCSSSSTVWDVDLARDGNYPRDARDFRALRDSRHITRRWIVKRTLS